MANVIPQTIHLGESTTLLLTVLNDDDSRRDLSTFIDIELQVKTLDGDADPPLISKAIGSGITLQTQSGSTIGLADVAIDTADTTTSNPNWPVSPDNTGTFRYDVWGLTAGGNRTLLVAPSNFIVKKVVNLP